MKKLFFLLIASGGALSAMAQTSSAQSDKSMHKKKFWADSVLSHWVVDINLLGGGVSQNYTMGNTLANYKSYIAGASNAGTMSFSNGAAVGFDAELDYFFGKKNNWGLGLGFNYLAEQGTASLNGFQVQYQSTDASANHNIFRQILSTDGPIQEKLNITNMNIPLLLKYKHRFSYRWGFTADLGALFNVQMKNSYTSNALFNYEAIYRYSDGAYVYDASPTPQTTGDVYYTQAEHNAVNKGESLTTYFNQLHNELGYNVGLGVSPNNNAGSVSYNASVGLLARPAVNLYLSDVVALNLGVFVIYQPFNNNVSSNYMLTNHVGDYSSIMNGVSAVNNLAYGGSIGLRIYLGKKNMPLEISSVDAMAPSYCGACDGGMVLHGLFPDKPVMVNYSVNGTQQPAYNGTTTPDGSVKLNGLCSGTYTGITAKVGKKNARTESVTLANPPMKISSYNATNPTANGACDGTISLYGLRSGQNVSVGYQVNGKQMPAFTGVVGQNGSITLTHLCEGNYSQIIATAGKCTATLMDNSGNPAIVTLTAPPPPPAPAPVEEVKVSTPILFEINKTVIHPSSYPVLNRAVELLTQDKDSYIIVDGYTDITGKPAYNRKLSMKRAKAVKEELMRQGIRANRIKIIGHGAKDPAADNSTPEGRLQNRRAVMHLNVGE